MARSRDITAKDLWAEAVRDVQGSMELSALHFERFRLMNRSCVAVVGAMYDLFWPLYQTRYSASLLSSGGSTDGNYGNFLLSYTSSTRTLGGIWTNPNSFTDADIGKVCTFKVGSAYYFGIIESITDANSFVMASSGSNLPSGNESVDAAIVFDGTYNLSGDSIDLSSLRIMSAGQQVRIEIESSVTDTIRFLESKDFRAWNPNSFQNKNMIVWTIFGDILYLKKGSSLLSYGSIILVYPAVPALLTADDDYVDVPDGTTMEIVTLYLRRLISMRLALPGDDTTKEMQVKIEEMYRTAGIEAAPEAIARKVQSLSGNA